MRKPNPLPPSPVPSLLKGVLPLMASCAIFGTGCVWHVETELYPTPVPCDTTTVTFQEHVLPIIENNCIDCHSGTSPSAGLDLSNPTTLSAFGLNGSLSDRIQRDPADPLLMPPNGPLNDCNQLILQAWINAGCLIN